MLSYLNIYLRVNNVNFSGIPSEIIQHLMKDL